MLVEYKHDKFKKGDGKMKGYLSIREAAEKWGVSERRVQQYCLNGRIPGAELLPTPGLSLTLQQNLPTRAKIGGGKNDR